MTMQDSANFQLPTPRRIPWNKGKLTGSKPPLRQKHVWAIRTKLQIEQRTRDLAMFNLARRTLARRFSRTPSDRPTPPQASREGSRSALGEWGIAEERVAALFACGALGRPGGGDLK